MMMIIKRSTVVHLYNVAELVTTALCSKNVHLLIFWNNSVKN